MPFLVELRAVMDWVWTDTTLSLSSWMCVEDIYANVFIIKCSRETEKVPGSRGSGPDGPRESQAGLGVPPDGGGSDMNVAPLGAGSWQSGPECVPGPGGLTAWLMGRRAGSWGAERQAEVFCSV